jgi:hypothetical protein
LSGSTLNCRRFSVKQLTAEPGMPGRRRGHSNRRRQNRRPGSASALPDPRLRWVEAKEFDGVPVSERTFLTVVEPTRLPDGSIVWFQSPMAPAFKLLTARSLLASGERKRQRALATTRRRGEDAEISNTPKLLDALADLIAAVLLSFTAIESYANEAIDRLNDDATVMIRRRASEVLVGKADMARSLGIEEKLDLVVPKLTRRPSIKGSTPWERFKYLKRLRDDLVHLKERGYSTDPDKPSEFGRLLRGDAVSCVADTVAIFEALEPGWLDEQRLVALSE